MTSGSEVMCRKKVDTPWSIYRVVKVYLSSIFRYITKNPIHSD